MYAAQEKAVLQEFHFILKKISDRVLRKTAQEVEQTAAAKATASAALAAVPGALLSPPLGPPAGGGGGMPSPAPSPRVQQPATSPFPGEAREHLCMGYFSIAQGLVCRLGHVLAPHSLSSRGAFDGTRVGI